MGVWAKRVRGFKEGTCWDEHGVLDVGNESLDATPEIIIAIYVN